MSASTDDAKASADPAAARIAQFLLAKADIKAVIAHGLRQAFDEVIDGPRTGRFRIEQLEKTEKTYIGTKVEIVLRNELELERGEVLDNLICGEEIDTKFSLTGDWMIPMEAVNRLCLVVKADDNRGLFSVGIVRASPHLLTNGSNQDKKKTLSALGKSHIHWILKDENMEPNVLLQLEDEDRKRILSRPSGLQRVRELFCTVHNRPIPRAVVAQVAQQKDPMRRARQMKALLEPLGLIVLCATYAVDRAQASALGFSDFQGNDWLVIPRQATQN